MVDLPSLVEGGKQLGLAYLLVNSDIANKVLGPTADYIGEEIKMFTEKRINNIKQIFLSAERKLGDKINQDGKVPPKVLRGILNEGSFSEDELSVEYFGGLLASSRSENSRDDRAAYYISLLEHLSSYQIRTHYVFYSVLKELFNGTKLNIGIERERKQMIIYIPLEQYALSMDFGPKENQNTIVAHSMVGLIREGLLDKFYAIGTASGLKEFSSSIKKSGVIFQPSPVGVEMFLWAHGKGELSIRQFFETRYSFDCINEIHKPKNCIITKSIG